MENANGATFAAARTDVARPNPTRVRYVAVRGPAPSTLLRFHPGITVLYGFGNGLADWLANAIARGAEHAPDGFAEIDGQRVSLTQLPDEFYELGPSPILRAGSLAEDLRHVSEAPGNESAPEARAITEAIAIANDRIAAIEVRIEALTGEISEGEQRIAELQTHRGPTRRTVTRDRSEDADQLEALVEALESAGRLTKATNPAAEALARAFDALDHAARRNRPRAEIEEELRKWELVTAEARARLAERRATAPRVAPEDLAEAARLRDALRESTERGGRMFRRRPDDDGASNAEEQLRALLERLGARSYEDLMLLGTGLGSADADLAIREATNVVAAAERRCADMRAELTEPGLDELRSERVELVERARQLLGHEPANRPADALRAMRIEPQALVDAEVALAQKLRDFGARVDGTLVDTAQALIHEWRTARAEQERGHAELRERDDEIIDAENEVRAARTQRSRLSRQIENCRTEIEDLEYDRERLQTRARDASRAVVTISPAIVDRAVAAMLQAAQISASAMPIVIEDPFDVLPVELRAHALDALARHAGSAQVVFVTADPGAVQWARSTNEALAFAWTADEARLVVAARAKES
ncbi:MAG: hypothetical protein JWL83_4819 [Actinomycetia bacterium]|nr:hypothetical protein [Actinomycetes bacterium]